MFRLSLFPFFRFRISASNLGLVFGLLLPLAPTYAEQVPLAPNASFSPNVAAVQLPLTVAFINTSTGPITSWSWEFGDGSASPAEHPTHTYTAPGTYTVRLLAVGPRGADTKVTPITVRQPSYEPPPIETETADLAPSRPSETREVSEVSVSDHWTRVSYSHSFMDPIVAAKPLNESDPTGVRIRNVDADGFEIRLDPQAEGASMATVRYIVAEHGSHSLEDGTQLEAGQFEMDSKSTVKTLSFNQTFAQVPEVNTGLIFSSEDTTGIGSVQKISLHGFDFHLRKEDRDEEINPHAPTTQTIAYIAWVSTEGLEPRM
ncbi:MAG: PKD domain-containing protein [Pseudomonadota bacterium]|nr:PKD domain-containing protein [Pseudomonadota bacterium]